MRRQGGRQTGHKGGENLGCPTDQSERSGREPGGVHVARSLRLGDDAWDVFADDAEAPAEPEYGDFWPDQDDSDEV